MTCAAYAKILPYFLFFVLCNLLVIGGSKLKNSDPPLCSVNCTSTAVCQLKAKCAVGVPYDGENGTCLFIISDIVSNGHQDPETSKLDNIHVWIYSLGSAFVISIAGIWGYLFLPLMTGAYRDHVMNVLIGLSFGSLITSALCQLVPEAYELGKMKQNSDYLYVAVFSMIGMWLTWLLQSIATIIGKEVTEPVRVAQTDNELKNIKMKSANSIPDKANNGCSVYTFPVGTDNAKHPVAGEVHKFNADNDLPATIIHRSSFTSYPSIKKTTPKLSKLAIVILAGDCINNFMDGISIGAGYSYYLSTGIKLTTAIAFEEYTHKLGDFAIVFQSGVPMRRVLFWNYTTSCACFLGVAIGIALGNMHWSQYIFSFASGLFLFISLSNMIPEMQNMLDESLNKSRASGFISLFEQHVGFVLAFVLLIVISLMLNVSHQQL